jgi:thiol-disulfide isomerase/thioredoxin
MTLTTNRRTALYAGVAALAAVAGAGLAWKRQVGGVMSQEALSAFWASTFETPSGESMSMTTFQGRPLVINFWATWCAPCIEEMPIIDNFFRQNESKGWQVLGLAIDQPSRVRQFLSQFPVNYKIGLAGMSGTEVSKILGNEAGGLPFTVVLDANGKLIQRKLGKLTPEEVNKWTE